MVVKSLITLAAGRRLPPSLKLAPAALLFTGRRDRIPMAGMPDMSALFLHDGVQNVNKLARPLDGFAPFPS